MTVTTDTGTEALPVAGGRQTWRTVRSLSRGHRRGLAAVAVLGLAGAAAGLVAPAVIGRLVDLVRHGDADTGTVVVALAVMVASAFAGAAGTAATVVLASRRYHAMLAELRERLVTRSLSLPQGVVERAGTGDIVSRTSDDVAQIADAAPQLIPACTTVAATVVVTFAGMSALDPRYGLTLLILLPVYTLAVRWYLRTGPRVYRAERAAMSTRAQQLTESQRGHATTVGLGLVERRHTHVLDTSWTVAGHSLRARTVQNMFSGRLNLAEFLGMATILLIGCWLIGNRMSTVGAATTAMLLFLRLFGPINQLLIVIDTLQSVLASLSRMVGVVTMPPADTTTPAPAPRDDAVVRLRGVRFGYDDRRRVLDGIDLTIGRGERVAVIGTSGAGKTTLGSVIAGVHRPDAGTVRRPPRTALITQEVHVFACTLRENVTLGAPHATDEQVHAALQATGTGALLDLLPDGIDTPLGTGGREPTAAQAQQIALARLVLADPELAILDEATAEAGSVHAGLLDRAAEAALRGRTGLVIAHRLAQAAVCDRIVVIDHGRVVEQGTHDELVAVGGVYGRLWSAWCRAHSLEHTEPRC